MTDVPRRSIEEIQARYQFEPSLDDVYVEGLFDQEIFTECLRGNGQSSRVVYSIDTVDVGRNVLEKYGLTSGNKQRVIALARELSLLPGDLKYRCVVDPDLDRWLNRIEVVDRLSWLDCCSIELYFLEHAERMIRTAGRAKIGKFEEFHKSFIDVLKTLYAFRLTIDEMKLNVGWIAVDKLLEAKGDRICFDRVEYVTRLIRKNGIESRRQEFIEVSERWSKNLVGDPRFFIQGHDFVDMVAWSIRSFRGAKELAHPIFFERSMVLSAKDFPAILRCIE